MVVNFDMLLRSVLQLISSIFCSRFTPDLITNCTEICVHQFRYMPYSELCINTVANYVFDADRPIHYI